MKIAILSWHKVDKPDTGGKTRILNIANELAKGNDIYLISPKSTVSGNKERFNRIFIPFDFSSKLMGVNTGILNYFFPINLIKTVLILLNLKPEVVISEYIWCAIPALIVRRKLKFLFVVDEHNIETEYARQRSKNLSLLVKIYEKFILRSADLILSCSFREKKLFYSIFNVQLDRIIVVPNGISFNRFNQVKYRKEIAEIKEQNRKIVLFMGKLDYYPNQVAVKFIIDEIMPQMKKESDIVFYIVGGPQKLKSVGSVVFTGHVNSVEPYLFSADVCICPIFHGSGTRLKILEYMASKRPVVSTEKGVEGINGIKNGKNIILAENTGDFTSCILDLLKNPKKGKNIGLMGFNLVKKYDWTLILEQLTYRFSWLVEQKHDKKT